MCIIGVVLVIQPDIIFKGNIKDTTGSNITKNLHVSGDVTGDIVSYVDLDLHFIVAAILSAVAGVGYSLSRLLLKRNPYLSENLTKVLFWSFIFGALLSAASMAVFETPVVTTNWVKILLIFGHCSSFVVGWVLALYSVKHISGNVINIISSTSVVVMLLPQYTFLSSILPGHKNWMEVLGVVLILLGSIMGSVIELCKSR